tara:strand:- start:341 stop:490 length:150 start_codon:yes stop_codon:yes gene_type:complete
MEHLLFQAAVLPLIFLSLVEVAVAVAMEMETTLAAVAAQVDFFTEQEFP